jgi:hypothetical protein
MHDGLIAVLMNTRREGFQSLARDCPEFPHRERFAPYSVFDAGQAAGQKINFSSVELRQSPGDLPAHAIHLTGRTLPDCFGAPGLAGPICAQDL